MIGYDGRWEKSIVLEKEGKKGNEGKGQGKKEARVEAEGNIRKGDGNRSN